MLLIQIPLTVVAIFFFSRANLFSRLKAHALGTSAAGRVPAGLRNLGNTCYMNSVLQGLFAAEPYRFAVLEADFRPASVGAELQGLFRELGNGGGAGNPAGLARSMGIQVGIQEDAEEFLLTLVNKVDESALKKGRGGISGGGGGGGGSGLTSSSVRFLTDQTLSCLHVDLTKHKLQSNFDLSVDIADHRTLVTALSSHFDDELLSGEAQYSTKMGMQDAVKALQLVNPLPDVLIVHLKRFSFDPQTFDMRKIGSPVDIPLSLDVKALLADAHSEDGESDNDSDSGSDSGGVSGSSSSGGSGSAGSSGDKSGSGYTTEDSESGESGGGFSGGEKGGGSLYELSAVVVHEGSLDFGHYYALVADRTGEHSSNSAADAGAGAEAKSNGAEAGVGVGSGGRLWHELNDHRVSVVAQQQVLDRARGGNGGGSSGGYSSNAYLAFYRRKSH